MKADTKGGPDKDKKPDLVADAHFRIDDNTRDIAALKSALGDHEKAAGGIVAAVMAIVDQRIEAKIKEGIAQALEHVRAELERYKREDKAEDHKMIADAMATLLNREETVEKHGTVETPDGVHKMHVVETRRRKH